MLSAISHTPYALFFGRETNDASRTTDEEDDLFKHPAGALPHHIGLADRRPQMNHKSRFQEPASLCPIAQRNRAQPRLQNIPVYEMSARKLAGVRILFGEPFTEMRSL